MCVPHRRVYSPEDLKGVVKKTTPSQPEKKASKPVKKAAKKKPIKKRSKGMSKVMEEVKKLYPIFLKAHPFCEIQSPDCIKRATAIHHTKGRGKNIAKQEHWKACCEPCNSWVESNHQKAADSGLKKSRHKIQQ